MNRLRNEVRYETFVAFSLATQTKQMDSVRKAWIKARRLNTKSKCSLLFWHTWSPNNPHVSSD